MNTKLLLVEDNPLLSEMYKAAFVRVGFDVAIAGDGAAGLAKIIDWKPDGVLLDLVMPGIDGLGVLQTLKDQESARPKVIVFTVLDDKEKLERALALGALECLNKADLTVEEVVERVRKHIPLKT
jgi:DNA-binding response OmpR family regulator